MFKLWVVNAVSFILLSVLGCTGLMNWLVLPKGYGTKHGFLISFRHFLIEVHQWTALLFMVVIAVHIALHWSYVKMNLKKHGICK
jgi:cytochrome b